MKAKIQSLAKVTARAGFTWMKIFIVGTSFSLICFFVSIYLLSNNTGGGFAGAAHTGIVGAVMGFITLFAEDFFVMLLCVASLLAFPAVYFTLANKLAMQAAIAWLWKNNLQDWFTNKVLGYVDTLLNSKVSTINDQATVKLRMLQTIRQDAEASRWQKKIFSFVMKKVKLDDVDFSDEQLTLSSILSGKVAGVMDDLAQPSNKMFYLALGGQCLLLVLALLFDQQ